METVNRARLPLQARNLLSPMHIWDRRRPAWGNEQQSGTEN